MALDNDAVEQLRKGVPSIASLRQLKPVQFLMVLEGFGLLDSFRRQQAYALSSAQRLSTMPSGSPQFTTVVNQAIDSQTKKVLTGTARRATANYSAFAATRGKLDKAFIWIVEGDDSTCENCKQRAGLVAPMSEWIERGLPGAEVCLGGDYCRCELFDAGDEATEFADLTFVEEPQTGDPGLTAINKVVDSTTTGKDELRKQLLEQLQRARASEIASIERLLKKDITPGRKKELEKLRKRFTKQQMNVEILLTK